MSILIMSGDGASPAAWLAQHRDAIQSNELAHSQSGNLEPRDKAGAQKSLQILSELHKQPGSAGYMLDVFQGNIFLGLRDGKAGAEHLLLLGCGAARQPSASDAHADYRDGAPVAHGVSAVFLEAGYCKSNDSRNDLDARRARGEIPDIQQILIG
jgi:hypothetical protein